MSRHYEEVCQPGSSGNAEAFVVVVDCCCEAWLMGPVSKWWPGVSAAAHGHLTCLTCALESSAGL